MDSTPTPSPRTVLGDRFEVGELLVAGGNSWVHACRDRLLQNIAAIKILKEGTTDARRRFLEESRILASLKHPHLVQVLAHGETDTKAPFMVLELLPGRSLDQRLIDDGPLPWREVAELIAQAAGALDALHRAGVIHRDVKPSNIVQLSGATDRPLVKLIDLGIAKVEDWGKLQSGGFTPPPRHQTATGLVVGTPGFVPPEVSKAKPNPRFDIFALGVTIFVLCTNEMPNLMHLRRMNDVRPECDAPPELEMLVAGALALDPDERIASAAEVQRRLDAIRTTRADLSSPYLFAGCYELLETLGVGAKGEVHRAYHMEELRFVALKLPGAQARDNTEECIRFVREAKALSVTRHPSLPELVECRTSSKHPDRYIAMALVRGKRASEFCVRPKCLKPADIISVGHQLAGALTALHARGILHRDLHNGNVLIDLGATITATILDLGMCEFTDRYYATVEQRYPTPPEHRIKLGTGGMEKFEWTAPEARATKVWTEKCDVYSLGLLLYKMLTGRQPFKGKTRELVSPRQYVPECPATLASALLAALSDDPTVRVDLPGLLAKLDAASDELTENDEDEVADALRQTAVPPIPIAAPPITPPTAARPPVAAAPMSASTPRPHRRWSWAPPTLVIAAGAALALAWWGRSPTATTDLHPGAAASVLATAKRNEPAPSLPAAPNASPVKPMREALDGVAEQLRSCAQLAGGVLILELVAEGDKLIAVAVQGADDKRVVSCVTDITTPLRFAPTPRQTLHEEFMP